MPENVEEVSISFGDVAASGDGSIKLDKVLVRSGLADSASDGQRKIKQGAVRIDNEVRKELVLSLKIPANFTLRVGRQIKRIRLSS